MNSDSAPDCSAGTMSVPEDLIVEGLRWSGAGWGVSADGQTVSVSGVDVGETARVARDDRGRGRLLDVVARSPHRIDGRCAQLQACPGCPLRSLARDRRRELTDALHRRALGPATEGIPWTRLPGASDDGGRARAVARALRGPDGRLVLGMVQRGRAPIALGACPLQTARCRTLVARLQSELRMLGVESWDPEVRTGTLRHVIVQAIGTTARVILAVDGQGPPIPTGQLLSDAADVSILVDELPRRSAGLVRRPRVVRGEPWLFIEVGGDRYRAGPRSWIPQAPGTVPHVQRAVLDALAPRHDDRVIEVGCGIGLLSVPIARRVGTLVGIDIERDAVLDAQANAMSNGVASARFRTGEAAHALRRLIAGGAKADAVVMHAMRRPFGPRAMAAVRVLDPERIVCLSPFAPALARDLAELPDHVPTAVALCDQTPGTVPDLTIISLRRRYAST